MEKQDIKSLEYAQLEEQIRAMGAPAFRTKQIFEWLYPKQVTSFAEMSNLPIDFRQALDLQYYINAIEPLRHQVSKDGTNKFLYQLRDGEAIESVFMAYHHGNSLCISTQAGCRMGCTFCASTLNGLSRHLHPSEMLDQILKTQQITGKHVDSLVLMGIGEPLDNYDHVLTFLHLLNDSRALNMSLRHVSLSTCGLIDRIYDLAREKLQLTLSVSLHAPNDELRSRIMPVNRRYGVEPLLKACRDYTEITHRRISFEYALGDGVNDSPACAHELGQKLKGMLCHVNLIPINVVVQRGYKTSKKQAIERFQKILEQYHISTTVRRTLGTDIDAACGQLRSKTAKVGGQKLD